MPATQHQDPPPPLRLREARLGDLAALLRLESFFPSDRMAARQFRYQIRQGRWRLRVAVRGGALLGYAMTALRRDVRVARLYSIAVDPDARGQGVGGALLADAEAIARSHGCTELRLEVRVRNRPAIAMYEARGYVRFERRAAYYEDDTDAFRYAKAL